MSTLISKASLLLVPSVYEDGTLYNVLPSGNKAPDETGSHNGYDQTRADFTFSRGSNLAATRVNADGLIEKGRENVMTYSNGFDNWTNDDTTETSGQEGYDGTNDAWKLVGNTNASRHHLLRSVSFSGVGTYSLYAKASGHNYVQIASAQNTGEHANFDLSDGSIGNIGSKFIDAKATSVGNGWYRLSVVTTSGANAMYISLVSSKTAGWLESWTMDNATDGILIQDAQLEKGLVATDYIETGSSTAQAGILEDMPRINYDANGENGALLLEPSRTNTLPYSEYLDAYAFARTDGTQNAATSPEGVNNAFKLFADTQTGAHYIRLNYTKTVGAVLSVFAKKGEETAFAIGNATGSQAVVFNLEDGTITSESGGTGTIEDYGSGWYRCSYYRTAWADWQYISLRGNFTSYTGDGSSGIYLYGLQFEDGSYSSSLIPTHGAAVTRGAESGVSDVDSLLTSNATYSWFVEFIVPESGIGGGEITFKDAGGSSQLRIYCNQNNTIGLRVEDGGQTHFINVSVGDTAKCLFQCSNGLVKGFYNGSLVHTFTVDTGMDAQKIHLGPPISAPDVKEVLLFNEALSDAECVTLTTL